jgi:hypothetical protein
LFSHQRGCYSQDFPANCKTMKLIARTILVLVVGLPILAIAAVWLAFSDTPTVARTLQLTPADIENAKRTIEAHDPRKARSDGKRSVTIREQELDLMLNFAASRLGRGAARTELHAGTMRVEASAEIPYSPFGRYLNVDARLRETENLPQFERLRVGRLPVPAFVANYLLRMGLRRVVQDERGELAADIVQGVRMADDRLTVTYVWNGAIEERARAILFSAADQARLRAYHDRLAEILASAPHKLSLATLLQPMFQTVLEREKSGDIVAENRAAIAVMALYANGTDLAAVLPAAAQWPKLAKRTITLAGRDDFPKHFLISAAIAAEAGSPLADAIGLHKEVSDSRGGSGFSFNDIGADRSGTRMGEVAVQAPLRARKLAQALAAGAKEADFMIEVADLPEFMPEPEFKRRFGGIGGAEYDAMMRKIESRVASRPLLR